MDHARQNLCTRYRMQFAFAIIAVFWWIAIWGLSDLLTDGWERESLFKLYITILILIVCIVWTFPEIIHRL